MQCSENVIVVLGWSLACKTIKIMKMDTNTAIVQSAELGGFFLPFIWGFPQTLNSEYNDPKI